MPREGIFARVIEGGEIAPGNAIVLMKTASSSPACSP